MIIAERKPIDEIQQMLAPYKRVLVLGCGGCVSVCLTGGEKQAQLLASQLRIAAGEAQHASASRSIAPANIEFDCITRQCDREFIANLKTPLEQYDAVLSLACGVGVGFLSELTQTPILPAMNTTFYGANVAPGTWAEYCHGCGQCMLGFTAGICPVARCSKSLVNGACGGTIKGKCEVRPDMDCAWAAIFKRLAAAGRLEEYRKMRAPLDWSKDRGKGVRRMSVAEMTQEETK